MPLRSSAIRGTQLGYISAERAPLIAKRLEEHEVAAVIMTFALARMDFEALPA
jgi:hypothetical protein